MHYSDKASSSYSSKRAQVTAIPSSGIYRVKQGDTLFSIAFRYGLDYRELAQWNRIASPYVIYPNQKIRLHSTSRSTKPVAQKVATPTTKAPAASPTPKAVSPKTPSVVESTTSQPVVSAPVPSKAVEPAVVTKTPIVTKPTPVQSSSTEMTSDWAWPVKGKVTRSFSNSGVSSKGIDIKSNQGELVKAAADGTVVYAGNGLIGYGNLVIIKHNDEYLSAYAYNESILVKEQQIVRVGDSLAIIGGKGEDRPVLHFEVRRDGQPIDPLSVLPK
nr:peptidoglycan DD-metalloendopeptidase family protein [Marinomonas algarum]